LWLNPPPLPLTTKELDRVYELPYQRRPHPAYGDAKIPAYDKRVFGLVKDFGTSQSPKSTRPLTTYLCPSRPGHQALRNNFASSLLLRTWLPMTGRRVRRPTLFSLWRKARRENSAASRLLGSTSLRFALHGWQRMIRFSINIMRGCFGGCTFCSITEHEGRIIKNRSEKSILKD
ncbi:hypothetical protein, partial [Thiolapillus sp.]|uniref:hypothetical protein n=1 Tax=Thiolapillus sp. TaxID=2017437 RepID=UPI003AF7E34D